ncbi:MAG: 50S ribosomal protein L9 [Actinobacteria bacterium]|nr:50S ribosomal protein L9 [Actinomycetota bacterium]
MKVILTQQVAGLGEPGDVVDVKDGYGRNFLVPNRLATQWTKGGEKQVQQIRRARNARDVRDVDHALEVKSALENGKVRLKVRAGEQGRLFGSVTLNDIVEAIAAKGAKVDKRRIHVGSPIKTLGEHIITVSIHPQVNATVTLEVVPAK